ncbi:MAG TPA: tetratricopeptide repeat protein, partial [Polyangia bacterium]|nr:tetratricopeptide repeat protein [Polyangia bacterium]
MTTFLVSSRRYDVRAPLAPRLAVVVFVALAAFAALAAFGPGAFAADDATPQARSHYEMGLKLFDARENEQALIEFQAADDLKPRPAALFMMAQCEYLLGRLKDARAHYARYATENPDGEFVELAKDRIQSIDKRPSTFVINTVPDDVTVHIRREAVSDGTPSVATDVTGQAPNNFQVPRGRYRIDVTKANYQGQTRVVDVDIAETKPLFFKLDPIPARLEIETVPPFATLYVNGNRARNPYRQDLSPGPVEVFAEAPDHDGKTIDFRLSPGEQKHLLGPDSLRLNYAQRSGRPELIVASSVMGALVGAGAVAAAIGTDLQDPGVASVLLVGGGGISGAIAGALIAQPLVRYIPDNR